MSVSKRLSTAMLAASLLASCAGIPDRHVELGGNFLGQRESGATQVSSSRNQPRLAIVLGGGGLRGYAHIGVFQALEEAGIRPDLVVGTSIGAIIGAAYAAGNTPSDLWVKANSMRASSLADIALRGPGFVKGDALASWANALVDNRRIEQFPIAFAAVATDLDRELPFVITRGDAGEAMRASAAIPGVFLPVEASGHVLVDGGVTSLVPAYAARELGADVVFAVDIYCHGPRYPSNSAMSVALRVTQTQGCLVAASEMATADVLITPAVEPAGMEDPAGREKARRLGYEAAIDAIPALRTALQRRSPNNPASAPWNGAVNQRVDAIVKH